MTVILRNNEKYLWSQKIALISLFLSLFSFTFINAQSITNYSFSAVSGSFSALSGGTSQVLTDDGTGWPSADDGKANGIPIGFDFWYMGTRYTTASVSSNGWMTLGANISNSTYSNNISTGGAPRPVIAPLWDDLNMVAYTNVSYATSGTAGSRVFTMEWLNARWDYQDNNASISFQVKLYENTGRVEFIYDRVGGSNPNNPSASIGITESGTGNGSYLSLDGTGTSPNARSNSATNNLSSRPASGQTYRFTPANPNAPSNLTFSNVVYNGMRLNWSDNSNNEVGFVIYRSDDGGATYNYVAQTAANATNYTATGLLENTLYYWRVYAVTEGALSSPVAGSQATCLRPAQPSAFSSSSDNVCKNQSGVSYVIPAVSGATSYSWSYSGAGTTINGSSTSVTLDFANNASSGTLSVSAVNSCGTGNALTLDITVSTNVPGRPGNFSTTTSPVCQGQTGAAYTSGTSNNATSYSWTYSGTGATINGTSNNITIDFSNAATGGTLTVYGSNACGLSNQNRSTTITVNPLPAQPGAFTASTATICQGQSGIAYTVPSVSGATSYTWSYSGSGTTINNGTTRSVTIDYSSSATSGILQVSAVNGCGAGTSRSMNITVNNTPAISQIPASGLIAQYKLNGDASDATGNNPGTLQGGPSSLTDRFGNTSSSYYFNGSTQYISTSITYNNPNNFTMSLWFKTTTSNGGKLIGLGGSQTGSSGQYDRHIYMTNSGQLYFGLYPGGVRTINTTSSYNDGNWHMVTASLSSTNGIKLYVDGSLISTDATVLNGENTNGYLRIAYDNLSGWTNQPSSFYFNGYLDDILVYNRELSASEISTLYTSPDGAGNNGPVCAGTTLSFYATSVSGATYSWTGPNGFTSNSQNPSLTYSAAYTGTYTVTVSTSGCTAQAYTNTAPKTGVSGQWIGGVNTNWSTTGNWCDMTLPTSSTNVVIPSTAVNMPTVSSTVYANNLTIGGAATLTNTSSGIINIYGNFTNNGTFTDNGIYTSSGAVVFTGSSAQSINGVTTFNNLKINNASGVSLSNPTTVNGILTLTSGTFTTNNKLSQNLYNGAIAGTGTGSTTGNINFFKTIWGDKYHYMSSPVSGAKVSDWSDNVVIKYGVNSNLYTYDETVADTSKMVGWTAVANAAVTLQTMKGYALYFPRWIYNTVVDVSGPYDHSATFSNNTLTNTVSGNAAADGWQLMGNPYPSTIDWDAASGWTKTNIANALYSWDGRTGRYVSYVGGVGNNGGTRYIGSMQGFFVKVNNAGGTGTLGMNNNVRVTSTLIDVWRTESDANQEDILRLTASSGEYSDETVLRFTRNASRDFDSNLDAYKILNGGTTPSLFTRSSNTDFAINSLPDTMVYTEIPLNMVAGFAGTYTLSADLSGFNNGEELWLEDRLLGNTQNLREDNSYVVDLPAGNASGRFYINYRNNSTQTVTANQSASVEKSIEIGAYQQTIHVTFPNALSNQANVLVFDATGKKVYEGIQVNISSGSLQINLPSSSGIYVVKVQTPETSTSQQVYLNR